MLGVNLAGGEFGSGTAYGTDYTYPNATEIDYYAAKGMDVIRVPFKIARVMPTKTGELNPTEVARLKAIVDYAETKGITTVLDAHDYGAAWGSAISTGTTTNAEFARFWGKMATAFKSDGVLFGLMNEPNSQNAKAWAASNNAAIQAIRDAGATQKILVPGTYWDGAHSWVSSDNDTAIGLGTVDPLDNYAFEVHQYLDSNSSGTSATAVSATIGSERLKAITDWARANHKDLFLGEFGAANNPTALAALDDMTKFMDSNTDVWIGATYWAGGPRWGEYMFTIEPKDIKTLGTTATDRPQMDVIEKYDLADESAMARPRVFISTDLRLASEEKDDAQSLIHALLYQDKMNIVGIAGTSSKWAHQDGLVGDIDKIIDVYGKDLPALQAKFGSAFKTVPQLKALSWQGDDAIQPSAGYSTATDSSRAIIAEAKKAAAAGEKLNVLTWGGTADISQALHDDPSIAPHIRLFNSSNQDEYAMKYIMANFRDKLDMWVDARSTGRGVYATPDAKVLIKGWHEVNAKGHGALGDFFSTISEDIFNVSGVRMGDSVTTFRFLSGDQDNPGAESWGGEFRKVGTTGNYWTDKTDDGLDFNRSGTDGAMTVYEDRAAWLASFATRFDWIKGSTTGPTEPSTGDDTLTVTLSGDDYLGDPNASITLDGKVIDATNLITADHREGERQTLTFRGDFDPAGTQTHKLAVSFTNDKWDGTTGLTVATREGHDRNLYIDKVSFNGVVQDVDVTMLTNMTKSFWFEV